MRGFFFGLLLALLPVGVSAQTLFLESWGVSYGSWAPVNFTGTHINYLVEDWVPQYPGDETGDGPGYGGEEYDVEAVYFAADDLNYYFVVVTGFPPTGTQNPAFLPGDVLLGDRNEWAFAFDADQGGKLLLAPATFDSVNAGGGQNWGGAADPWRVKTYGSSLIPIGLKWRYGPFDGRYAIEASIPKGAVGTIGWYRLHWTMECGNDVGDLYGILPPATPTSK